MIFTRYQANRSVLDILPQIVQLLCNEVIGKTLPLTVKVQLLLKEVKQAVCADYQNLEKFATILCEVEITLSVGRAIREEYGKRKFCGKA